MARKRRSYSTGPVIHLCNRAAGQLTLFQSPFEYKQILTVFREALEKFPVSVFAFCIMPNHWHLLCRTQETGILSRFMHWFGTTHAMRWRISHENVGRGAVYQNRFRSHRVEGTQAFLKTAAYIERNALAAGLVQKASAWPWGSASPENDFPLSPWPHSKPGSWSHILDDPLDGETLRLLRYAQRSSHTFKITPPKTPELAEALKAVS